MAVNCISQHIAYIIKTDLFNGRQVFNEMNDLNLKTYPISIHFMAFDVEFSPYIPITWCGGGGGGDDSSGTESF